MAIMNRFPGGGEAVITFTNTEIPYTTKIKKLIPLAVAREHIRASTDKNGSILIAGGVCQDNRNDRVEKYFVDETKIELTPLSSNDNRYVASTDDGNGNVLFSGGGSVDRYSPSGARTILPPLAVSSIRMGAGKIGDGSVLFAGGDYSSAVTKYTLSGVGTLLTPLANKASSCGACNDGNGNVAFAGGRVTERDRTTYLTAIERYNSKGEKIATSWLTKARDGIGAAKDGYGNILFGGGAYHENETVYLTNIVEKLSASGVVTNLSPLTQPGCGGMTSTDGMGNVIFAGGYNFTYSANTSVDKYTKNGVKTTLTSLKTGAGYGAAATFGDGSVMFAGGGAEGYTYDNVVKYSAEGNLVMPIGTKYKINSMVEQTASQTTVTVSVPLNGYIKYMKGVI